MAFGPEPCSTTCPACGKSITTHVEHKATTKTHILAALLCILGCCPCALALYCTGCARDLEHYCPSCNALVGTYTK
ncbi:lipopolysaccharide-induced tumor necrosis factor-alpha factor homolog [Condylostylus longicornis]|uniref:lipopolysaccharide-induced tumor necrosis factor-alpha factor homolog n=1 Tax=Condylostylus longicornis TaxID=2530218 RepID=UPI00244E066D|nr:lipopolysaccharide-induced tumor necrosis factor-alpha factor homolog [Condylostylus longicornis]